LLWRSVGDLADTVIVLACGTATTMAGLLAGLYHQQLLTKTTSVLGFSMLKGGDFLHAQVQQWLAVQHAQPCRRHWNIETDYHFGGYAKRPAVLTEFVQRFISRHGIAVDDIYTGKLLAGLYQHIAAAKILPGTRILMLHTGGLQIGAGVEKIPTRVYAGPSM
jgi:1-aminocyclopropane-1-carboxylate deaminase/D-cysteine desulfhydrase-like pyridoxal-dependent ACC family enzyme